LLVTTLSLAFLGPFTVTYGGQVVTEFRTRSVQALLAYLTVEQTGSRPYQREALAELLWPGYPSGSARKNLRQALYELGRLIPEVAVETGPPAPFTLGTRETIQINPECCFQLDTTSFNRLTQEGSIEALSSAVDLYRGDFLEDFALPDSGEFETWAATWRGHFRRQALEALERLTANALQQHDYSQAETYARRQLAIDDLRETSVGQLMQALARQGQRSAALIAYDQARLRLHEELGVVPGEELSQLREQIRTGEIGTEAGGPSFATLPSVEKTAKPAQKLPAPATPFIGRRSEVEQIKSLIINADIRLLTLTGPGGTGKTRLSIQAGSEIGGSFPDGVFFVPLASVHTEETLISAVAKAIGFSFYREERPRQQLLDYLRGRQLLLILDNFEQLIGKGARGLTGEMLSVSPGLNLMITSRVQLNMQGEQLYPVTGMRIAEVEEANKWDNPEKQSQSFSAVQLFLDRARRMQPDFALTKENVASVIEICHLVQGIPLGLELAAAWVGLLPPDEIAAEIARSLDFLETDQPDVPDRQRSLRAVFESSWTMLNENEREAFLRMCVFVSSFSREAAQKVSGASLRTLLGLANKSWLQQIGGGRFELHELMRQYGEQRLKTNELAWRQAKSRHAEYFAGFVNDQSLRMQSSEQLAGLSAMTNEFDTNIKTAWDWLVAEGCWNVLIERMLMGLFQFGMIRWQSNELIPWLREARLQLALESGVEERIAFAILGTFEVYCEENVAIEDASPQKRMAKIWQFVDKHGLAGAMGFWFVMLAGLLRARNLSPDIGEQLEANISRLRDQKLQWQLGVSLLFMSDWLGEFVVGLLDEGNLIEAAKIFEELGVIFERGIVAENLGNLAYRRRRPLAEVDRYYTQAQQFYQQLKSNSPWLGINLIGLADIYFQQGKYDQGFALFGEEQRELERMGQKRVLGTSIHWESLYAARYSTFEHALRLRQRSIELARQLDSQSNLAWRLFELGEVYRIFGEPEKALELYDQTLPMFERMNIALAFAYDQRARGDLALEEKRYADALEHYQKFKVYLREETHNWSIAQSRARIALAQAYLGNIKGARLGLQDALVEIYDLGEDDLALQVLLVDAVCLLQEGNLEAAIELASFLLHHPGSWNETKQHARGILESVSHDLDQETVQAAIERGKGLELDAVMAEWIKPGTVQGQD
jgi:predicted ATPase/DNA-binding SARP family transcriptional activator